MKDPIKKPKNQANMWSTENSRFCEKYIEKQPKTSQNNLFSAVFWSKRRDFRLRRIFLAFVLGKRAYHGFAWNTTSILLRRVKFSSSTSTKKRRTTVRGCPSIFWSKCGDSNSRPPVPEQIRHRFLTTFVDFLVLFSPKTMLSDALVRTVST